MTARTVLVTGSGRGIGRAVVLKCLEEDCHVIGVDCDDERQQQTRRLALAAGHAESSIDLHRLDLADGQAVLAEVPRWPALQGGLFGLVNNAAIQILKSIFSYSVAEMDRTWQVNMRGPLLMMQACYPFLQKARGSIVNIGSVADTGYHARYALYGGSKAFLHHASRHVARDCGFQGVRINVVSPGGTETPLMAEIEKLFDPREIEATKKAIPIEQRWARAEEIAETVWFALSGPRYLHGADLRVHGG